MMCILRPPGSLLPGEAPEVPSAAEKGVALLSFWEHPGPWKSCCVTVRNIDTQRRFL